MELKKFKMKDAIEHKFEGDHPLVKIYKKYIESLKNGMVRS